MRVYDPTSATPATAIQATQQPPPDQTSPERERNCEAEQHAEHDPEGVRPGKAAGGTVELEDPERRTLRVDRLLDRDADHAQHRYQQGSDDQLDVAPGTHQRVHQRVEDTDLGEPHHVGDSQRHGWRIDEADDGQSGEGDERPQRWRTPSRPPVLDHVRAAHDHDHQRDARGQIQLQPCERIELAVGPQISALMDEQDADHSPERTDDEGRRQPHQERRRRQRLWAARQQRRGQETGAVRQRGQPGERARQGDGWPWHAREGSRIRRQHVTTGPASPPALAPGARSPPRERRARGCRTRSAPASGQRR